MHPKPKFERNGSEYQKRFGKTVLEYSQATVACRVMLFFNLYYMYNDLCLDVLTGHTLFVINCEKILTNRVA